MGKFNEYTQKATPEDNDTLMIYDDTSKANKLSPFSGIWNWIVGKLTNAVIANLQTNNKTVLGAINELNSNLLFSDIGTVAIETSNTSSNQITVEFPTGIKLLYISYGTKNGTQSYGGATIIIDAEESKPCFVPIYMGADIKGYLYIFPQPSTRKIMIYGINLQTAMLVKIKGK